jgi:hypothetical protein
MIPCRKSLNVEPVHMRIERSDAAISWQDVTNLFKAIGWGDRSADEVQAAFARSTFKVFAFDDVEFLGFGRHFRDRQPHRPSSRRNRQELRNGRGHVNVQNEQRLRAMRIQKRWNYGLGPAVVLLAILAIVLFNSLH